MEHRVTKSRRGQPFCLRGPILTRLPRENGGKGGGGEVNRVSPAAAGIIPLASIQAAAAKA